jgi:hypothetical protein
VRSDQLLLIPYVLFLFVYFMFKNLDINLVVFLSLVSEFSFK